MQITDNRTPVQTFDSIAGGSSSLVANGAVVEIEGVSGQFIKIPNKGDLRAPTSSRRFINLASGQVYQCSRTAGVRVVTATLTLS